MSRVRLGFALMYLIDPHKYTISRQELLAHLLGELFIIDRRFGMDADSGKLFEDPVKAIVLWCGGVSGFGIAAPEDSDYCKASGRDCVRACDTPRLAGGAALGRASDGMPARPRSHAIGSSRG
jgi:hypothetical protein